MQKLFLVALVVCVCTPAIMAQESAKAGIYGGLLDLRSNAAGTSKQDVPQNLRFKTAETGKEDVNILPQEPKSTFSSTIPHENETGRKYVNNPLFNSRAAAGRARGPAQCPPSCPGGDYNKSEIFIGFSYLGRDFRIDGLVDDDIDLPDDFDFEGVKDRIGLNGVDLSYTYNFSQYWGFQIDFSTHRRTRDFDFDLFDLGGALDVTGSVEGAKFRQTNLLFGVQVKDNSEDGSWFRPFGHALAGFSREKLDFGDAVFAADIDGDGDLDTITVADDDDRSLTRTSFALALGGGIDFRITDNFSIRAIKFDYLPVFAHRRALILAPLTPTPLPPIVPGTIRFLDDEDVRRTQHNFRAGIGVVFHW